MSIVIPTNLINDFPEIVKGIEVKIPKIIHQTYKSIEKLPEVWKNTPQSWINNHPEWEYVFWSDDDCRNYIQKHFPWFLEVFDGYEYPIQRADAIRYCILYMQGGLYADCDIESIKPLDDLFYEDSEIYLIKTPANDVVTNCFMASKPKSEFWNIVLKEMVYRFKNPSILWIGKHWKVMYTTGPMMLNYVFNKYKTQFTINFLPRELLLPTCCNICSEKPCHSPYGYTKLLPGCSWNALDSTLYNWLYCNCYTLLLFITVSVIIFLYIKYKL